MADGKKKAAKTSPEDGDIIEAEVIHESSNTSTSPEPILVKNIDPPNRSSSNAAWIITSVLMAFIGGLFAAPYFNTGLTYLGLAKEKSASVAAGETVDLLPLQAGMADLNAQLQRHQEILAQHDDSLTSATNTIQDMKGTLASRVTSTAANESSGTGDLTDLKADITRLTEDITRLATIKNTPVSNSETESALALLQAENAQISAQFNALKTQLAQLEAGAIEASPKGRLLLALSKMKERALKGFAFTAELEALRVDLASLSAVDQQLVGAELAILNNTSAGITPFEKLMLEFEDVTSSSLQAVQREEGSFLTSLFTVRRTDAGAIGNDAIFLTAEKRLAVHNISGAVEVLKTLEGAALAGTEVWRGKAEVLVSVDRAFNRIITGITNSHAAQRGQS